MGGGPPSLMSLPSDPVPTLCPSGPGAPQRVAQDLADLTACVAPGSVGGWAPPPPQLLARPGPAHPSSWAALSPLATGSAPGETFCPEGSRASVSQPGPWAGVGTWETWRGRVGDM